jgi:CO/xanthine dehydrogenase FAD-binding subunit
VPLALDLDYLAPTSLEEALAALAARGGDAALLAGGTDLVPWLRDELVQPRLIVDLKRIPGLADVEVVDGRLQVGCLVTFSDLLAADVVRDRLPVLAEMAQQVASVGIRNRATLVGNLCSAVPSGDAGPIVLTHDAEVSVRGPSGSRTVPIEAWFAGPRRTCLAPWEIVTGVSIPLPPAFSGAAFARLARYRGEDLAQASVAVLVAPGPHVRVAFAAVGPTPLRARRIERLLATADVDVRSGALPPDLVERAVMLVAEEIAPITDVRATDHYRLRMSEVMLRRALAAATSRAAGGGPAYGTPLL